MSKRAVFFCAVSLSVVSWLPSATAQEPQLSPQLSDDALPGLVIVGQNGVLHSGPDGTFFVVPDQQGGVSSYVLQFGASSNLQAGGVVPLYPQQQVAGVQAQQPEAPVPQVQITQAPVVCECYCPPCPEPGAAQSPQAPLGESGSPEQQEQQLREQEQAQQPQPVPS